MLLYYVSVPRSRRHTGGICSGDLPQGRQTGHPIPSRTVPCDARRAGLFTSHILVVRAAVGSLAVAAVPAAPAASASWFMHEISRLAADPSRGKGGKQVRRATTRRLPHLTCSRCSRQIPCLDLAWRWAVPGLTAAARVAPLDGLSTHKHTHTETHTHTLP